MPKKRPAKNGPFGDSSKTDLSRPADASAPAPTADASPERLQQAQQNAASGRVATLLAEIHQVFERAILLTDWLQRAHGGGWPAMTDEKLADFRNLLADVCAPLTDLETRLAAADQDFAARVPPWQHLKMNPLRQLKPAVERVFIGCRKLRAAADQPNAHEWSAYCTAAGGPLEFLRQDLDGYKCQEVAVTAAAELGLSQEFDRGRVSETNPYFRRWIGRPSEQEAGSRLHQLHLRVDQRCRVDSRNPIFWRFGRPEDRRQRCILAHRWGLPTLFAFGFSPGFLQSAAVWATENSAVDSSELNVDDFLAEEPERLYSFPRQYFIDQLLSPQSALGVAIDYARLFENAVQVFAEWVSFVRSHLPPQSGPATGLMREAAYENYRIDFRFCSPPPRIEELWTEACHLSSLLLEAFRIPSDYWRLQAILELHAPDLKRLAPSPHLDPSQPFDPIKSNALEIQNRMAELWSALHERLAVLSATETVAAVANTLVEAATSAPRAKSPPRKRGPKPKCDPDDQQIQRMLKAGDEPKRIAKALGRPLAEVRPVIDRNRQRLIQAGELLPSRR